MGFGTRQPTSNEPFLDKPNPWGPQDDIRDDVAVLLGNDGKRCVECKRVILNEHLKEKDGRPCCPDCFKL